MSDQEFKVTVVGCSGVGRLISTVVRQAVYMIEKDRPDQVNVVSSGSLTGDVPEALSACRNYPLLLIDGCRPRCASAFAAGKKLPVAAAVYAADVIANAGCRWPGSVGKGWARREWRSPAPSPTKPWKRSTGSSPMKW